jgi:hypothetical protein
MIKTVIIDDYSIIDKSDKFKKMMINTNKQAIKKLAIINKKQLNNPRQYNEFLLSN